MSDSLGAIAEAEEQDTPVTISALKAKKGSKLEFRGKSGLIVEREVVEKPKPTGPSLREKIFSLREKICAGTRVPTVSPFVAAVIAEFVGTFIFQLIGGSMEAPVYNGILLTVVIYMTAGTSGGNINPAVSTALWAAGEIGAVRWASYCLAQLSGAVIAAFIAGTIDPFCFPADDPTHVAPISYDELRTGEELLYYQGPSVWGCWSKWGNTNRGPGCVPNVQPNEFYRVFLWEAFGTFVLVCTVFGTAVAKPGHGSLAPLAIGASISVSVGASGGITGGAYNPARFFGPALAFGCGLQLIWLYWLAELAGALVGVFVCLLFTKSRAAQAKPDELSPPLEEICVEKVSVAAV